MGSLLIMRTPQLGGGGRGGSEEGCVSDSPTLPDTSLLFFYYGGTVHLLLRSFSRKIISYVGINLLYPWEEMSSGSSYMVILNAFIFN